MSTKTSSFLLAAALAIAHLPGSELTPPVFQNRKIQVGQPMDLTVAQSGAIAVPLTFVAGDYKGPYDPFDPSGVGAAERRRSVIEGEATLKEVKSFIPPGSLDLLRKEVMKVVMNEGGRFALAHPKEAAELVGIVTKISALYGTTTHNLKALEKKQASHKV